MKKIANTIDITKSTILINIISRQKLASIRFPESDKPYDIELHPINKGIKCDIYSGRFLYNNDNWNFNNLEIDIPNIIIKIPQLFLNYKSNNKVSGKIPNFEIEGFSNTKKTYHRLFLPINKKINFLNSVENILVNYNYNSNITTCEATEITIKDNVFHIFLAKQTIGEIEENYLVIDSQYELSFSDFSEYCFSILICFGYIAGDFINDDGYFFQYLDEAKTEIAGLRYSQLRGSINCHYAPVHCDPYALIHDDKIAEKYFNKPRGLSIKEFSNLCSLCYSKDEIKTILILILETNTQSLVSSPGILSIVLETFSNFICNENEKTTTPIPSRKTSKSLRAELLKGLEKFKEELSPDGYEIIKNKITQINQMTNKEKLLLPFKILNIPINKADIEAIEQRNAFLHGREPMVQDANPKSNAEADSFRHYLYLKIYVLISAMILKYIGFDNMIINYPKIHENGTGITLDEEYYRQI